MKKIRKAIFPIAGLGTRLLPATKVMPKEMLILGDKPLIQHAYEEALEAGIEEFIFITNKDKLLIEKHFKTQPVLARQLAQDNKLDLLSALKTSTIPEGKLFVEYQENPLGLGHAVLCARDFIGDEPFAVILPDDIILNRTGCLKQLVSAYEKIGGNIVATTKVAPHETSKYGILDIRSEQEKLVEVTGLVEKPAPSVAPSLFSVVGRYILQPAIFDILGSSVKGYGREIQLTDALAQLIGTQPFHGLKIQGRRLDCGSHLGYFEATVAYALSNENMAPHARKTIEALLGT